EQHLQPLTRAVNDWPACLREHPAGALWLGQQYGLAWPALAQLPATLTNQPLPALPTRDQWAQWRLEQSRQLRQQWQDEQGQIDIQAAPAYPPPPAATHQRPSHAPGRAPAQLPATLTNQPLPALPTRDQWAQWRLEQSRQLRQQWQDEQGQIDIQAALAYHRLPADTYQLLYNALSDAQKTAPAALLACLNPSGQ